MSDIIIIGAGISGITLANLLAETSGKKILLIDKRNHLGGNCYDYTNDDNILVHQYGPHIFHTDYKACWEFLSGFTEWNYYQHKVTAFINGNLVSIPINLRSLTQVFPTSLSNKIEEALVTEFGFNSRINYEKVRASANSYLHILADFIFDKLFRNYSEKQWGCSIESIDRNVLNRIPIVISNDDRYFSDRYQGIPYNSYTEMFKNMLSSVKIEVLLNTDANTLISFRPEGKLFFERNAFNGIVIYTGMIDQLFDYNLGRLEYRSLHFHNKTFNQEFFQNTAVINYPNDYDFTRITEHKRLTMQMSDKTTISYEYPRSFTHAETEIPYYPISNDFNNKLYTTYRNYARQFSNLYFCGRIAEFSYMDMDDVIFSAMKLAEKINSNL